MNTTGNSTSAVAKVQHQRPGILCIPRAEFERSISASSINLAMESRKYAASATQKRQRVRQYIQEVQPNA